jgi:UDP-N-acetyl-D-galactosamine dehydrogenase
MDINTFDVLEASSTKWNFLKFYPGLVGGHCIGVDPYYLTYKSSEIGYPSKVILAGRHTNDSMGPYVAKETIKELIRQNKPLTQCRVLVMGATFKENVSDIRNSKVIDVIKELESFSVNVDIVDPYASKEEFKHEYGLELKDEPTGKYDAVILAVAHKEYLNLNEEYFQKIASQNAALMDIKGLYRNQIKNMAYWSL